MNRGGSGTRRSICVSSQSDHRLCSGDQVVVVVSKRGVSVLGFMNLSNLTTDPIEDIILFGLVRVGVWKELGLNIMV